MTSRRPWTGVLAATLLLMGCENGAKNNPRQNVPKLQPAPVERAAEEMLKKKADSAGSLDPEQAFVVESERSAAADGLRYYWTRLAGRNSGDYQVISIAGFRGRYFDPADLRAWSSVLGEWVPESADEALDFCIEAVAVGVTRAPERLPGRGLLELRTAHRLLRDEDRARVNPADVAPVVERRSQPPGGWTVLFWYPEIGLRDHRERLATRYRCTVPSTGAQDGFAVAEVDSILRVR
jgi:hypothetical protein